MTCNSMTGDVWLFTYGSLMWAPIFDHQGSTLARLDGWHRSMCILSHHYRGTPDRPGLVLGLDRGGRCLGRAYRIDADAWPETRRRIDERELVNNVYHARFLTARIEGGGTVTAYAYVADRAHKQYWSGTVEDAARMILSGSGCNGPALDYLTKTVDDLAANGVKDRGLTRLMRMIADRRHS